MRIAFLFILAVSFASGAFARPLARTVEHWDDLAVSRLLGRTVKDTGGRELGRVEDLVIDTSERPVHYLVVSFGGWLELGDRHRLFPLSQLAPGAGPHSVVVEGTRERLAALRAIEPDDWPTFESQTFWDRAPAAGAHGEPLLVRRYVRATTALGKPLLDRDGDRIGELEDFVVNLGSGAVRHAVVELDRPPQPAQRMIAVPLHALGFPADRDAAVRLEEPS